MAPQSAAALQNVIQAAAMLGSRETSWMGKVPASGQNKKWDVHIKSAAMLGSRETSWMGKVPETSVVNLDPDPVGSGYGPLGSGTFSLLPNYLFRIRNRQERKCR